MSGGVLGRAPIASAAGAIVLFRRGKKNKAQRGSVTYPASHSTRAAQLVFVRRSGLIP